jgi:hypothetical protein
MPRYPPNGPPILPVAAPGWEASGIAGRPLALNDDTDIESAPWQGVVHELTHNRKRYTDPMPPSYLGPLLPQGALAAIDDLRKQVPLERSHVPGMKPCAYALLARGLSVFMKWPLVQILKDVVWEQSSVSINASDHVRLSVRRHLEAITLPPLSDGEEFKLTIDQGLSDALGKLVSDIGLGGRRARGKGRNPLAALCIQIALAEDPGDYNVQSRKRMRDHVEDVRERFTVEAESARVLLDYWRGRVPSINLPPA